MALYAFDGTWQANEDEVDLGDTNVAFGKSLTAVDLVETTTTVGGVTLTPGTILTAVESNTSVGKNALNVQRVDIFALDVAKTTVGSGIGQGDATATLLLDFQLQRTLLLEGHKEISMKPISGSLEEFLKDVEPQAVIPTSVPAGNR